MRQLVWMARGKWNQVSAILAQTANINRGKGQPAVRPDELNPYRPRRKPAVIQMPVREANEMLAKALGARRETVKASEIRVVKKGG